MLKANFGFGTVCRQRIDHRILERIFILKTDKEGDSLRPPFFGQPDIQDQKETPHGDN